MQDLEDHFRLSYREFDEVVPLIAEAAAEIVNSKQRKHPKEPSKYREDQKLFWSCGYQNWTGNEFKERLRINRETFSYPVSELARPLCFPEDIFPRWCKLNFEP